MDSIVQWATILSPIIAVALAWWTSRSGARDTAKLVATMKEMIQMQLQLTMIQLEKEFNDANARYSVVSNRESDTINRDRNFHYIGGFEDSLRERENEKRNLSDEREYQLKRLDAIHKMIKRLADIQKQVMK